MKLSTKGRYGLRAMVDLAVHSETGQLVGKMRRAGLVTSVRGATGGYRLAKSPSEISVGDVLRALEGTLDAVDCPGNLEVSTCKASQKCVTKYVWKKINESISQAVDTIMIEQLVQESKKVNGL